MPGPEAGPDTAADPQQFLHEVLISSGFAESMRQLGGFTLRTDVEGGYAAYADGSALLRLPADDDVRRGAMTKTGIEAISHGYTSFSPVELQYDFDEADPYGEPKFRSDLRLLIHSHPVHPQYRTSRLSRESLTPSLADLENWEDSNVRLHGYVEGVTVQTEDMRDLLLWRKDPTDTMPPYYMQLEDNCARATMLRVMRESGIRTAQIDLELQGSAYAETVEQATKILFS